jgi:hypothetical protein
MGDYIGGLAWPGGKGCARFGEEIGRITSGARRVRPGLLGRDDRWGLHVSDRGKERKKTVRGEEKAGRGPFRLWTGFCPRGLLSFFPFLFLFPFFLL